LTGTGLELRVNELDFDRNQVTVRRGKGQKVIGYLGTFDRLFGVPVTTRNWNTMTAIARVLGKEGSDRPGLENRAPEQLPNKRLQASAHGVNR
jgi:hypothetical protein